MKPDKIKQVIKKLNTAFVSQAIFQNKGAKNTTYNIEL